MFLLHINKYRLKKVKYRKDLIEKIKTNIQLIEKTTTNNKIKKIQDIAKISNFKVSSYKSNFFLKYVIGIFISKTNITIFLTNIKGEIKHFVSSSILKLNKKQNKITIISKLFKILLLKNAFLKKENCVVLHFKNVNQRTALVLYSFISRYFKNILSIKIFNNKPYNGCRPKKIKRKKNKIVFDLRRNV